MAAAPGFCESTVVFTMPEISELIGNRPALSFDLLTPFETVLSPVPGGLIVGPINIISLNFYLTLDPTYNTWVTTYIGSSILFTNTTSNGDGTQQVTAIITKQITFPAVNGQMNLYSQDYPFIGSPGPLVLESTTLSSDFVCTPLSPSILNLTISKTDSPDPISVGQNLTYTITVTNIGQDSTGNIVIQDILSAQLGFVSASVTVGSVSIQPPLGGNGLIQWEIPPPFGVLSGSATLTIVATVLPGAGGTIISNTSTISATIDTNIGQTTSTTTTTVICPTIILSPATLPNGVQGTPYEVTNPAPAPRTITASGGTAPYTFTVNVFPPSPLPPGLTLNATTGIITGTPTTAGTFPFIITATDANGCTGQRDYTITIAPTPTPPTRKKVRRKNGFGCPQTIDVQVQGNVPPFVNLDGCGTYGNPTPVNPPILRGEEKNDKDKPRTYRYSKVGNVHHSGKITL